MSCYFAYLIAFTFFNANTMYCCKATRSTDTTLKIVGNYFIFTEGTVSASHKFILFSFAIYKLVAVRTSNFAHFTCFPVKFPTYPIEESISKVFHIVIK